MKSSEKYRFLERTFSFIFNPLALFIIAGAAAGLLLAFQTKLPIVLTPGPHPLENYPEQLQDKKLDISLPIFLYSGPMIVNVDYDKRQDELTFLLLSGEKRLSEFKIPADQEGTKRLFIFAGDYDSATGLQFRLESDAQNVVNHGITRIRVEFPKVGHWLIPDLRLWITLTGIIFIFGMICSLVWESTVNILASYTATALMIILAVHFGGFNLAWRIDNQFMAVLFLFVVVLILRWRVFPKKQVQLKTKS